jgi:hypothetical protein
MGIATSFGWREYNKPPEPSQHQQDSFLFDLAHAFCYNNAKMQKTEKTARKLLGVIDALSGGFELVLRHPWVLLIPIALDLFLWLGPQINAKPLFDQTIVFLSTSVPADASAETLQSLDAVKSALQAAGDTVNVFGVMAPGLFPTLFNVRPPETDSARAVWFVVPDGAVLMLVSLPLAHFGMLIASIYLESIARAVRQKSGGARTFVPRLIKSYVTLVALALLALVGLFAFAFPVALGATMVSMLSAGLGAFMLLGGSLIVLWAALYLAFAIPSIFVSGSSAAQSVLNSISIFHFNFSPAISLVFLTYLIQMGFAFIWQQFTGTTWGVVLDVVANAFLGSGLIAALMLFYNDRFTWLTQVRERIRQQQTSLKG